MSTQVKTLGTELAYSHEEPRVAFKSLQTDQQAVGL